MKTFGLGIWIIVVAVLSVGFSEVTLVTWLNNAPMEVTNNLFWLGIVPAILIAVGLASVLMFKALAHKPRVYIPLYIVTFIIVHSIELHSFFNPIEDIAAYVAAIFMACLFWYFIWWRRLDGPSHTPED
jgi:hypothetical protein